MRKDKDFLPKQSYSRLVYKGPLLHLVHELHFIGNVSGQCHFMGMTGHEQALNKTINLCNKEF